MRAIKGTALNVHQNFIGRFSNKNFSFHDLLEGKKIKNIDKSPFSFGTSIGLSTQHFSHFDKPIIMDIKDIDYNDGDILKITPDGMVERIWDVKSKQNVLFLTDQCNSRCIMCPQPLTNCGNYAQEVKAILTLLKKDEVDGFCLSGGEPTILKKEFLEVLQICKKKFVDKPLLVLTNGRNFKDFNFTKNVVKTMPKYTTFAIPIYSSVSEIHDNIVGVAGAFAETILGIQNLIRFRAVIEIRTVILQKNYKQLPLLSDYIGWNFPVISHVAFMGMEVHNMADKNLDSVWIEPLQYREILQTAVKKLDYRNINVSIYNIPYCLLTKNVWKYSCQSISDWKEYYLDVCNGCAYKANCAGLFRTSSNIPMGIHPILNS